MVEAKVKAIFMDDVNTTTSVEENIFNYKTKHDSVVYWHAHSAIDPLLPVATATAG